MSNACNFTCRFYKTLTIKVYCGERGIRTPGTLQYNGFQDRRIRPLCHFSGGKSSKILIPAKGNLKKILKKFRCLL